MITVNHANPTSSLAILAIVCLGICGADAHGALVADWKASAAPPCHFLWEGETGNGTNLDFVAARFVTPIVPPSVSPACSSPCNGTGPAVDARNAPACFHSLNTMTIDAWFPGEVDATCQKGVPFTTGDPARSVTMSYDSGVFRFIFGNVSNLADCNVKPTQTKNHHQT